MPHSRVVPEREAKRGRIVAQMKFRARDFHRDPFLHPGTILTLPLSSLLPFFVTSFYFAPPTEHVHSSGEHFRPARPAAPTNI